MFQRIKELFKKEPIADVEEKRKAVEWFCESQNKDCKTCWLRFKIPWYDECHYSDEDVDYSYSVIYGDADPKEINKMFNIELKPCPFCGGNIMITLFQEDFSYREMEADCQGCRMHFKHTQHFATSREGRVPVSESFVDRWNRRAEE